MFNSLCSILYEMCRIFPSPSTEGRWLSEWSLVITEQWWDIRSSHATRRAQKHNNRFSEQTYIPVLMSHRLVTVIEIVLFIALPSCLRRAQYWPIMPVIEKEMHHLKFYRRIFIFNFFATGDNAMKDKPQSLIHSVSLHCCPSNRQYVRAICKRDSKILSQVLSPV